MAETFKPSQLGERVVSVQERSRVWWLDNYPVVNREPCAAATAVAKAHIDRYYLEGMQPTVVRREREA